MSRETLSLFYSLLKNKSLFCGFLAGLCLLLVCTYSAFDLYQMRVFDQDNMILGGDPGFRSLAFAYGYGERSLVHPNMSNFINPLVRVIAAVFSPVFPDLPMKAIQMRVALWVSPACAALATYMVYLIALTSGIRFLPALALSVVYGFSISTIAYGSIPDHFMISAFLLATGLYLLLINARLSDRNHAVAWTVLVTFAIGITLSNVVPMIGMYAISDYTRKRSKAGNIISNAGLMFVRAGLLTIALWACLNWVYQDFNAVRPGHAYDKHIGRVVKSLSSNPARDAMTFPFTVGQAFWGGTPDIERDVPVAEFFENARYESSFVYNPPFFHFKLASLLWLVPGVILGVSLFLGFTRESGKFKPLAMAVLLIIMFNWLLHTFWGNELFLFSPHWHFASVAGLIPLISFLPNGRRTGILIVSLSGTLVVMNLEVWVDILQRIPSLAVH
jgi:hypothetical protein